MLSVALGAACMVMAVYGIVVHCPRSPAMGGAGVVGGLGDASEGRRVPRDAGDGLVRTAGPAGRSGASFSSLHDGTLPDDDVDEDGGGDQGGYFSVPTPYVPCLGILVNWYLIAQLDLAGIAGLLAFLAVAVLYYYAAAACSGRWGAVTAAGATRKRTPSDDA
jgi:hypothetical protein